MSRFVHLHVHTQYSILDGAAPISSLIKKAVDDGMTAFAVTDHGNMFGTKDFLNQVGKHNGGIKKKIKEAEEKGETCDLKMLKPIVGCEVYVARQGRHEKKGKENGSGHHLILLAKNITGYHNLAKLVSLGFIEGFYYKPRIDKEILEQYSEGIVVTSACLGGEIPQLIMNHDVEAAEESIKWFKRVFGEDYYLELQRHPNIDPEGDQEVYLRQQEVNKVLIELAQKNNVKLIATNDVHFVNQVDAKAHDILICLNTGADINSTDRMRYTRQEWFKTQDEMCELFADVPEALANTLEIADKIEFYSIESDPLMPNFPIPENFANADDYLKYLTYEGAKKKYVELTEEITERIDFELDTIKRMGFPGYFLIVQDFINAGRKIGVAIGPGRGSAAGSAVAYCLDITDIDPIKYDLLFERFLNPDRISMPDIDIDFDDDGRELVLNYVRQKYGADHVANIITFGSMAAKSAIRDVARVLKLPLSESDRLAKLVPEGPKVNLKKAFEEVQELADARRSEDQQIADTLRYAETLEGSIRNTGVHACGVIIGKDDLTKFVPISTTKDAQDHDVLVTQYEGSQVESIGLLKMDFLGLKTLSIIKEAIMNIRQSRGIELDINKIPLEDEKTYTLYSNGETTGTFQFESDGMKKYLRELKPSKFEDLIAMNALYRPGPMDYIPDFIARKLGKEPIEYDFPVMEKRLKDTYGITVYQEQVMLLSRDMAGFTRGESDKLRKAMGKKQIDVMNQLKEKFLHGCEKNNLDQEKAKKVWADWEKFAAYAFNKSHATCYSWVAYQTGYLKANFPAEYMAAVLSRNISDIKKITTFMDECKRMGMNVLGPDVNESELRFTVNKNGDIRFGLGAIKGVGEAAVQSLVEERNQNGPFQSIYDFVERVNLTSCNRKNIEAMAIAGGLDSFGLRRSQFFAADDKGNSFSEQLIRYGQKFQSDKNSATNTLFGMGGAPIEVSKPEAPRSEEWSRLEQLNKEKELIGIYLSAHPLDPFKLEFAKLVNCSFAELNSDIQRFKDKEITLGGMVTNAREAMTKTGKPFGAVMLEDYSDSYKLMLFGKDYVDYSKFFKEGYSLLIKARVQPRKYGNNPDELEVRISKVMMLADAREELKMVSLKVPLLSIDDNFVEELSAFVSDGKEKGVALKVMVYDAAENKYINLATRNIKINLSNEFISFIEGFDEIEMNVA
jgi:DNA polymerase-3 subunit alpha